LTAECTRHWECQT